AQALADYTACLALDPANATCHFNRAGVYEETKAYDRAGADYAEAIRLDPGDARFYNGQAWLLATCPDARSRNGGKAVASARRACELTGWKNPDYVDTLAAAHAEAGQFDEAVRFATQALNDPTFPRAEAADARKRLELYQKKQPYRDE